MKTMRLLFFIVVFGLLCASRAHAAPPSGAGWALVWNDEFEGTTMDTAKWRHWLLGARRDAVNSPSAVSVGDGKLVISTYTSGGTHYTGMISTESTYPYTYGYIEARINYDSNPGMWSAFWMQSPTMGNPIGSPNSAGTEIDICEHRKVDGSGVDRDGNIGGVIHWDGYGTDHRSYGYDSGNLGLGTGYHIYGMEWTPTQQKFYIDGVLRWTINNATTSPVSQRSEFIILSSEVENGGWSSTVPAGGYGSLATTTTKMEVDYVRVYRRAEAVVNGDFEGKLSPFGTTNQASWSSTGGNADPACAKLAPTTSAGASVQQTVRGLLPDTGYTLTAWGNAGATSPSLAIGVNSFGGSQVSQTLTSGSYAQAKVPFTTGSTNRTASVFAKSNNSGSTAYADDFFLRRHAAVNDGQIESGSSDGWTSVYGGAVISSDGNNYGGEFAWKIPASGSSAGIEQEVAGLTPSTAYRLTGWTTNGNAGLTFGVKNHGASQVTSTVTSGTWARGTVNFTTGASNTTATIFAYRSSSAQTSYADSFFLFQPLASPWTSQDVSATPLDGTAGRLGGKFVVQACGANIGSTSDKMHFIYQTVSGDATITARILGVDATAYYAKAGVMIRESTAEGARSASITWGPVNQLLDFSYRASTNGSAVSATTERDFSISPWVRLTRRGNVFTAYTSPDGAAWTRVGTPQTISMSASALIGIPACSGDTARLAEAALDNVIVSAAVPDVLITSPVEGTTVSNNGASLRLTATITGTGTPVIAWSKVSGPGTVTFANAALADTSTTFSGTGTYIIRCSATSAAGTGSDDSTINVSPVPAADPTLVLRLKLDESSGTVAGDSSGSGNNGTVNGGLAWQPSGGKLTGAALFNGTDSYIAVPDNSSLDNTAAFTLSYWFYANNLGNNTGLVAKRVGPSDNNSYGTFLGLDGKLSVDVNSSNDRFTSNTTFNSGTWYHIALVFNGSLAVDQRVKLYVNGVLDTTQNETSTSIPNYTSALHIGTLLPGSPVFDGLIDDVRFHRRALSASEIAAIKNETGTFAPTVSTGPAPAAIANTPATLNGSVSAGAGPAPSAAWTKVSGPGNVVFANAASPATTVTFDQPGTYVLRLTASNANGQTFAEFSDTVFPETLPLPELTITNPPAPVSLNNASHALRITASVNAFEVPGTPAYAWTQISGPGAATFADPTVADTTASFSAPGNYVIRCTVTNAGGSDTAETGVTVASSPTISLRQGENGYAHTATFLRADSPAWNSGARDQMLAGKKTGGYSFRPVFSFPLTGIPANATLSSISLDLWTDTAGVGSVGTLELRELTATPVEGTGSSSTDAANGAGTGATWTNRTQTTAWTTAGGDFNATILSSVPGFSGTATNTQKTFPSTSSFLSIGQTALTAGQPLNLLLISPISESGANDIYTRLTSDDSTLTAQRPRLTLTWSASPAPVINPGPAPGAIAGEPASLTGSVTGATSTTWSLVSGPGSATFGNADQPATTVTFNAPGAYVLQLSGSSVNGETSRTLAVTVLLNLDNWRQTYFGTTLNSGTAADTFDANGDGELNLMEFATAQNPNAATLATPTLVKNGATLEFTYTRSLAAMGDGVTFTVEYSDTLATGSWSSSGIEQNQTVTFDDGITQTLRVAVPAGDGPNRFVRLKVVLL